MRDFNGDTPGPPLVIGYGNTLRGDDGFGPAVVARVAELGLACDALAVAQLAPELAESIAASAGAVFVDAAVDLPVGAVRFQNLEPATSGGPALSHHCDPRLLLLLARAVFGRCPPAVLARVGAEGFGFGTGLAPAVRSAIPVVVEQVERRIAEWSRPGR